MGGINFSWLAVWVPSPYWLRRKSDFRGSVIKLLDDMCWDSSATVGTYCI